MKIVCDKIFFVKSHPRGLGAKNCQKRAIFGNFSSFYIKNHPEEKIWNGFACYPTKSLRGQPSKFFKPYLRSLSPLVWFLQDFEEMSVTFKTPEPYLWIFFRWQNICWTIFAVCQLLKKDWDVFVQKWAHTDFLLLNICISYNAMALI